MAWQDHFQKINSGAVISDEKYKEVYRAYKQKELLADALLIYKLTRGGLRTLDWL
jgi:hypothetical protein